MATIVTRAGKGAPLTHDEVDANFDNLNSDKYEAGDSPSFSNITISDKIIHSGDTNTSIRFPAADTFTVETAGSERMRIDSSGNVGIGTSSPSERVEIYGASPYILLNNTEESSTGIKFADAQATEQTAEISARVTGTTAADVDLQFIIGGNDRMWVYGNGDVKIFGNNTTTDTRKFTVESEGYAVVTINGDVSNTTGEPGGSALQLNIDAGDPNAVVSAVNSDNDSGYGTTYTGTAANSMLVGTVANNPLHFGTNGVVRATIDTSGNTLPGSDNSYDLGTSSFRWDDVYATNGTIQTSDRNEKTDIAELDEAEKRVAIAAKGLIRKYRWKDAVAEKGDEARIHVGIIAQDLQDAFAAEGLDAGRYAMFVSSTWWEVDEVIPAVEEVLDDEGNVVTEAQPERTVTHTYETAEEAPEGAVEKTRMGVRYPELLAFIIGAL